MLNIQVYKDVHTKEDIAKFLEEVARDVRDGKTVGDGWEIEELDKRIAA